MKINVIDKSGKKVEELEDKISSIKVKKKIKPLRGIVSDFKWKVEYCYRSKNICGFYADNSCFILCLYFNDSKNIKESDKMIYHTREMFT